MTSKRQFIFSSDKIVYLMADATIFIPDTVFHRAFCFLVHVLYFTETQTNSKADGTEVKTGGFLPGIGKDCWLTL